MQVPVSGKVIDRREDENLTACAMERNYTASHWCARFADGLRKFTGASHCILVNSGSSANLLALKALTQREMGRRRLLPGDEIITAAVGFPTTLAPILDIGAVPVLVDVTIPGFVLDTQQLQQALTTETRAVVVAHTLGYPANMVEIKRFCDANDLWLIEDTCDALGSRYDGRMVGTWGDFATLSFYPAHHVTTGEGGALLTASDKLARVATSLRDWGRACWCEPGCDNTCGHRFDGDYDHKYTYSRPGYNLKMTDFAGAIGCAQMEKISGFVRRRKANHFYLFNEFTKAGLDRYFTLPCLDLNREISWFGFALLCKSSANRNDLCRFLDARGVGNRPIMGGNLLRQPGYKGCGRAVGDLPNANKVHEGGLWVGCWPGLLEEQLDYTVQMFREFYHV